MMTGVFHFMAISFGEILACCKLGFLSRAVNREPPQPDASSLIATVRLLLVASLLFDAPAHRSHAAENPDTRFAVLIYSKTSSFRHDSIPQGIAAIRALGAEHCFAVDATEDAERFNDAALARYNVVVFLNTTGDVLDPRQKTAFERYIRAGGGFVGIHSASDTEYQWPWYGRLIGAWFASHPAIQRATVRIEDPNHPSTKLLPQRWERIDEWYNFRRNPRGDVRVLAALDETTYSGGTMGSDHPIAWCQSIDSGRSWYTAMGHASETYAEPLFRLHLLGGIESAAGSNGGCQAPGH
jgi:cytochrome c